MTAQGGVFAADYIDENGKAQKKPDTATRITSETTEIGSGWYYVDGTVTLTNLRFSGNVNLILTDGSKLYMTNFCTNDNGDQCSSIYSTDNNGTLSIYVQKNGTGTIFTGSPDGTVLDGELLKIYGALNICGGRIESVKNGNCTIIARGDVKITDGYLKLKSQIEEINALGSWNGDLNISGGTVSANAKSDNAVIGNNAVISDGDIDASTEKTDYAAIAAEYGGKISITGGKVQVRGGKGMRAENISLGRTSRTDSFFSHNYTLPEGEKITLTKDFKKGDTPRCSRTHNERSLR